jgi:hypothetical protein
MGASKIKSLTIAALIMINAFFLSLIIMDNSADARDTRQAIENACAVLESGGIMINPDDVRPGGAIRTMHTSRALGAEGVIADTLLGPAEMTDLGHIYQYESGRGHASFSIGGEFEVYLNEGAVTDNKGALRTVRSLLRDMRLEAGSLTVSGEPGNETVVAVSSYKNVSIFNCAIEFEFTGGSLKTVKGRFVSGIGPFEEGAVISPVATVLLRFLAEAQSGRLECSRIYGVEAGYQHHTSGPSGDGVIAPAWLITTDTGQYVMDDA